MSNPLKLKTAEERAAEIRAESAAIEAEQAAKKAEKAKITTKVEPKAEEGPPEPNYAELAKAEEARAAKLKAEIDEMQMQIDPSLRPKKSTETVPHVVLTELLNKHDNAEDALNALHDAIRKMRDEPGLNTPKEVAWPDDLSHLTETQRAKTLAEMEAGRKRSEAAAAQQEKVQQIRREQNAKTEQDKVELAKLKEQLAEANKTIAVLRHNPGPNEVFPAVDPGKVAVGGAA